MDTRNKTNIQFYLQIWKIRGQPIRRITGIKRPGREPNHSPPTSADVKKTGLEAISLHSHTSLTSLYDRLCGLVVIVPGYTTEMYCVSCKVRTEFIYVM
jgi:hypothetical protein